jgi:hypothetical protein
MNMVQLDSATARPTVSSSQVSRNGTVAESFFELSTRGGNMTIPELALMSLIGAASAWTLAAVCGMVVVP